MKKVLKIFVVLVIVNFTVLFSFLGWLGFSVVSPSLENTDISIIDLISNDLDQDAVERLEKEINNQAGKLGTTSGKNVTAVLDKLIPNPDIDLTTMPETNYPYPSLDEVMEMNNVSADEGMKKGMQYLKEQELSNQEAIKQGLSYIEENNY